ncbi:acetate uptake transporter family protein [Streptomyces sp. NPDC054841]
MSNATHSDGPEPGQNPPPGRHHEPDLRSMTRINLRPIASPMPLGFFTVAIASTITSVLQLGLLDGTDRRAVALTVLPAFVLQLLVSILAFGARDVIAATLMGSFAGTWLANGLVLAFDPPGGSRVLGVLNLVFAVFAALMVAVTGPKRALRLVLVVALPRYAVAGAYGLSGIDWLAHVAGAIGLLLSLVAMYAAYALMLEDMRGEQVLPLGRSGPAYAAVEGDLSVQLRNLERQAGVRRTL